MARIIPCPVCKNPVANNATACPKCGTDVKKAEFNRRFRPIAFLMLAAVAVFLVATAGGPTAFVAQIHEGVALISSLFHHN